MVVDTFQIALNNSSPSYIPGSKISGHIIVKVSGEEFTNAITVKLFGTAETRWIDQRTETIYHPHPHHSRHHYHQNPSNAHFNNYSTRTVDDHYYSNQTLLEDTKVLFGDGHNKQAIPPGEMKLPFTFQLPTSPMLPISGKVHEGFVQYGVEGRIKIPGSAEGPNCTANFLLLAVILDLNTTPTARAPSEITTEKKIGFRCCRRESLIMSIKTEFRGWAMGQQIPVVAEIHNKSGMPVIDATAQLVQVWILTAEHEGIAHVKMHKIPVGTRYSRGEVIDEGDTKVWQVNIEIPRDIPPSPDDDVCEIIKMDYFIRFELLTDSKLTFVANLPIIVGNVPLKPGTVTSHSPLYEGVGKT